MALKMIPTGQEVLVSLISIALLSGCASNDSGEAVAKAAFEALKRKDWNAYKELTTTPASIALSADKVSPFKKQMTYVGSSIKTEEEERIKSVFDAYCQKDCLKNASIASVTQSDSSSMKIPWSHNECVIPIYRYKIGINGKLSESICVVPDFVVTKWKNKNYLLYLKFENQGDQSGR